MWSKATAHQIWTKYSNNFYSGGTTFTHVVLFHYSKFHITIRTTPPPPFAVHSIKLIIDTTQFFPFEGGPSSVRGSHTPNFGPDIQRTCHAIRILSLPVYNSTHHCAMSYRASIRPNVVVPFHRWTTCGPRQLHTKFGPNIRTTSIPAGPLLLMFSYFTIQNFKLQFDPPRSRSTQLKSKIDKT